MFTGLKGSQKQTDNYRKRSLRPMMIGVQCISCRSSDPRDPQHRPLYLRPLAKPSSKVWYSKQPVGVHKTNTYMKEIACNTGVLRYYKQMVYKSQHTKITVHKLQKTGIFNDKIAAVTRHQNEQSLQDYAIVDMEDHQRISAVLSVTKVL